MYFPGFSRKYQLQGCGAAMSPLAAVNGTFNRLHGAGRVEKQVENGIVLWRKKAEAVKFQRSFIYGKKPYACFYL